MSSLSDLFHLVPKVNILYLNIIHISYITAADSILPRQWASSSCDVLECLYWSCMSVVSTRMGACHTFLNGGSAVTLVLFEVESLWSSELQYGYGFIRTRMRVRLGMWKADAVAEQMLNQIILMSSFGAKRKCIWWISFPQCVIFSYLHVLCTFNNSTNSRGLGLWSPPHF